MTTFANRTLTLMKKIDIVGGDEAVESGVHFDNLEFEWKNKDWKWDEEVTLEDLKQRRSIYSSGYMFEETQDKLVKKLTMKIKDHITEMHTFTEPTHNREEAIRKLHENSVKTLLPFLADLDYNSLMKMKQYYFQQNTEDEHFLAEKNVFLEMLPVTGTYPAALVIHNIILNNDLNSDLQTAKFIATVPFHIRPVKTLVDEFYKLIMMKNTKTHLALPFTKYALEVSYAHMVRRTCYVKETEETCFKALNIEEFFKKFDRFTLEDTKSQKHMMNVFKNFMYSEMLEKFLVPIVKNTGGKKYSSDVRTFAIYALTKRAVEKGHEIQHFLPLFLERDEPTELRIAAFDAMIKGKMMTITTMDKIMTHMMWEPDMEVFNYVYTSFERMEKMYNDPCYDEYRRYAQHFLKYWRQMMWMKPKYSFGLSKSYSSFFINEVYEYSGAVEMKTIGYHRTMSPLSIQVDFKSQYHNHVSKRDFGFYIRMEGVAPRIMDKIKSMTWLGQMKVDELKQLLLTDMQIRHRSDIPAKFDITLFKGDNIVLCYHMDDREIMSFIDQFKTMFMQMLTYEDMFKMAHHVGFTLDKFHTEMPTDFGVPLIYYQHAMTMVGLTGDLKKEGGVKGEYKFHTHLHSFNVAKMFFIHPDQKTRFMLQHTRTYKHQLKSGVKFFFDWITQKLDFTFIVPEQQSPFSWLAHSYYNFYTRENKIEQRQEMLTKSCPTCEHVLVVTKGKEKRRNVELFDNINKWFNVYGLNVETKFFDCELPEAVSPGLLFNNIQHAFNPWTKEPKSFFTFMMSGVRQFWTYLYYFPRAESCGFNVLFHKSTNDPTKMINFTFDLKKWAAIERPSSIWKERFIAFNTDVVFKGTVDKVHHMEINFNTDPTWSDRKFDVDFKRMSFTYNGKTYPEWTMTITSRSKPFPKRESTPFMMKDLTSVTKHRMKTYTSIVWDHDHKITVEGDHKTTMEGVEYLRNTWYYKQCLKEKESPEWKSMPTLPHTDACIYSMMDLMTLRHFTWDVTATKLEPWMVNLYMKMSTMIKTTLLPFWTLEPEVAPHQITPAEPTFHLETIFRPKMKMFDMLMRSGKDVSRFLGVRFDHHPWLGAWMQDWQTEPSIKYQNWWTLPLPFYHTSYLTPETFNYMIFNDHINMCTLSKDTLLDQATVHTFDNVTYIFTKEDPCWTLLSADCVENPTFAVFYKMDNTTEKMSLMLMIGNTHVEFVPTADKYRIYLKGKEQLLRSFV